MSFQFTYEVCHSPGNPQSVSRDEQSEAAQMFQQYKRIMKEKNNDIGPEAEEETHFIQVGVTDEQGQPMEGYSHTCTHTRG